MTVRFFDAQFMLYEGEIDKRIGITSYLCIPLQKNVLDANNWIDIAFIHSLRRIYIASAFVAGYEVIT